MHNTFAWVDLLLAFNVPADTGRKNNVKTPPFWHYCVVCPSGQFNDFGAQHFYSLFVRRRIQMSDVGFVKIISTWCLSVKFGRRSMKSIREDCFYCAPTPPFKPSLVSDPRCARNVKAARGSDLNWTADHLVQFDANNSKTLKIVHCRIAEVAAFFLSIRKCCWCIRIRIRNVYIWLLNSNALFGL